MPTLETALRLMVIGQELLIAAVIVSSPGNRAARFGGAMLMLGVAAYLYTSDPVLRGSLPLVEPLILLFATVAPLLFWLFARAIFEAPWPPKALVALFAIIGAVAWASYLVDPGMESSVTAAVSIAMHVAGLLVALHALWIALQGRPDDLIEGRRMFRLVLIGVVALQVVAVLAVELIFGAGGVPAWLDLANAVIIAVVVLGLAIPMLRLNAALFEAEPAGLPNVETMPAGESGTVRDVYHGKLLTLMDEGYYRETGLTIPRLAAKLDYPEHQLRRLINGHLGYRNFSAFLSSYRIDEAKRKLADPELARTPVLTIALDLGYASLGPFNRAFKATTGMTPTDYRRRHLAPADSG